MTDFPNPAVVHLLQLDFPQIVFAFASEKGGERLDDGGDRIAEDGWCEAENVAYGV